MTSSVTIAWAGATDIGRVRERNEDCYHGEVRQGSGTGSQAGLFVVCDGMGGHSHGQEASALVVAVLKNGLSSLLQNPDQVDVLAQVHHAILAANAAVFDRNEQAGRTGHDRAGTTLALLLVVGAYAWVAHVGDSRVYRICRDHTSLLTTDHNIANREIRRGIPANEAWIRQDARHLTQALGPRADEAVLPDIQSLSIDRDALFMLCTDGVSDNRFVDDHEHDLLRSLVDRKADLARGCKRLIDAANEANGQDNLTAVLVRVSGYHGAIVTMDGSTRAIRTMDCQRDSLVEAPESVPRSLQLRAGRVQEALG
jgi:protein phosphatase